MRYLKAVSLICLVLFGIMPSCVKNTATIEYVANKPTHALILQKDTVKKGEPFFAFATPPDSNSTTRWTIRPSDGTVIIPNGNQANISIYLAGIYVITANFYSPSDPLNAYDSSHYTVTVNDSVYSPSVGSGLDTVQLFGDQLNFTPVYTADSGFKFIMRTSRVYKCSPYLTAYQAGGTGIGDITMNFGSAEVIQDTGGCSGARNPVILNLPIDPLPIGVHTISIFFVGITYQGLVNVTDSNLTFTWNYTNSVVISPLQIKKN